MAFTIQHQYTHMLHMYVHVYIYIYNIYIYIYIYIYHIYIYNFQGNQAMYLVPSVLYTVTVGTLTLCRVEATRMISLHNRSCISLDKFTGFFFRKPPFLVVKTMVSCRSSLFSYPMSIVLFDLCVTIKKNKDAHAAHMSIFTRLNDTTNIPWWAMSENGVDPPTANLNGEIWENKDT